MIQGVRVYPPQAARNGSGQAGDCPKRTPRLDCSPVSMIAMRVALRVEVESGGAVLCRRPARSGRRSQLAAVYVRRSREQTRAAVRVLNVGSESAGTGEFESLPRAGSRYG